MFMKESTVLFHDQTNPNFVLHLLKFNVSEKKHEKAVQKVVVQLKNQIGFFMVSVVDFGKRNFWESDHDFFKFRKFNQNWTMWPGSECDKMLRSKRSLNHHLRKKHNVENKNARDYQCGHCEISFTRSCNLLRHLRSQHQSTKFSLLLVSDLLRIACLIKRSSGTTSFQVAIYFSELPIMSGIWLISQLKQWILNFKSIG